MTLANTSTGFSLVEEPSRYHFTYSGGMTPMTQTVESGVCTGGMCRDVFTVSGDPPPQYVVSVVAENRIGMGTSNVSQGISKYLSCYCIVRCLTLLDETAYLCGVHVHNASSSYCTCFSYNILRLFIQPYFTGTTNNFLEVIVDITSTTVQCRFLGGFTGTAECQIEYSTREDLSGSVVDTGSSTSGDTVTVDIAATLQSGTTYYYIVTATTEGVNVGLQGFFRTGMLL